MRIFQNRKEMVIGKKCRLIQTSSQNFSYGVATILDVDTVGANDVPSLLQPDVANNKITCQFNGTVRVTARNILSSVSANATGWYWYYATINGNKVGTVADYEATSNDVWNITLSLSETFSVKPGDEIKIVLISNSATPQSWVQAGTGNNFFEVEIVG